MRHHAKFIAVLIFTIVSTTAATVAFTAPAQPQTRVETDQATGTVLFIVNGREEARIDRSGLHVRQNLEYGGILTDAGSADQKMTKAVHAP